MERNQFSPERLAHIRRLRKARRLYKRMPMFAFALMSSEYPDYTYEKFWDDLRYRTRPKRKRGKSPLIKFGRYRRMEKLNILYKNTGNTDYALQAQRLRKHMTKPYRVLVKIAGETWIYSLSPLIQIEQIERITTELPKCRTQQKATALVEQLRKSVHNG